MKKWLKKSLVFSLLFILSSCTSGSEKPIFPSTTDAIEKEDTSRDLPTPQDEDYSPWVVTKEATCDEEGEEQRHLLSDESIIQRRTIPAKGHTPGEVVIENYVQGNCSQETTYDEVIYCKECHNEISRVHKSEYDDTHLYVFDSFVWDEDYSAKAKLICKYDSDHVQYEDAEVTSEVIREANWFDAGLCRYTATYEEYSEEKEVPINPIANMEDRKGAPIPEESFVFKLNEDEASYTITEYNGDDTIVEFPAYHQGLPVTAIGMAEWGQGGYHTIINYGAFERPSHVVNKIIVPDTVTTIHPMAFSLAYHLVSVEIGKNVKTIEDYAFLGCYKVVEVCNLSELKFGKGSPEYGGIAESAIDIYTQKEHPSKFRRTDKGMLLYDNGEEVRLMSVYEDNMIMEIPEGVTAVNRFAFYYPQKLISLTLPSTLKTIDDYAVYNPIRLAEIINRSSIEVIKGSVNAPISDTLGRKRLFDHLISVHQDAVSRIRISDSGFVTLTEGDEKFLLFYTGEQTEVFVDEVVDRIAYRFLDANTSITSLVFADGLKSIEENAISSKTDIRVTLPSSLNHIHSDAFTISSKATLEAIFGNTENWIVRNQDGTQEIALEAEALASSETAGTYLASTYKQYTWERIPVE